jgi:hypothetical protein
MELDEAELKIVRVSMNSGLNSKIKDSHIKHHNY